MSINSVIQWTTPAYARLALALTYQRPELAFTKAVASFGATRFAGFLAGNFAADVLLEKLDCYSYSLPKRSLIGFSGVALLTGAALLVERKLTLGIIGKAALFGAFIGAAGTLAEKLCTQEAQRQVALLISYKGLNRTTRSLVSNIAYAVSILVLPRYFASNFNSYGGAYAAYGIALLSATHIKEFACNVVSHLPASK